MALTTEQTLLLNNLMYMEPGKDSPFPDAASFEGQTVGDLINSIDPSAIDRSSDYGSFMTGEDWANIIEAVRQDDTLMSARIADVHVDPAGGGHSAVFLSQETGDAVVVFKGTQGAQEWMDNFQGGNTTDTDCQKSALAWYQEVYREQGLESYEVTVSGHSKGGNKAKYITVLDGTVDRCVSFDGQGFSDQFMEKYADQIAARQGKVENHNVDYDYVNFLLNDLGESTFYKGQDYGDGGFLENHCPNTFLKFGADGSPTMEVNPDGQAAEIQALDHFLNSMLRSAPEDQRAELLTMVNDVLNVAFSLQDNQDATSQDIINLFLDMAADPKYSDALAYLVAYTIEYEQANPELLEQVNSVLGKFGMEEFTRYVDMADSILGFQKEYGLGPFSITVDFDLLYDLAYGAATALYALIPDGIWDWVLGLIRDEYGIDLTREELMNLLKVVGKVNSNMDTIQIRDNGADIRVESAGGGPFCTFSVQVPVVRQGAGELQEYAQALEQCAEELQAEAGSIAFQSVSSVWFRLKLNVIGGQVRQLGQRTRTMGTSLEEISALYEQAEQQAAGRFA